MAALTRPDGLVHAFAFPLAALITTGRNMFRQTGFACLVSMATFVAPVGAYLNWRWLSFGDYLPNPVRAKGQRLPGIEAFERPAELITHVGWLAVVVAVAAIALSLARGGPTATAIGTLPVPLTLAVASYAVLHLIGCHSTDSPHRCGRSPRWRSPLPAVGCSAPWHLVAGGSLAQRSCS